MTMRTVSSLVAALVLAACLPKNGLEQAPAASDPGGPGLSTPFPAAPPEPPVDDDASPGALPGEPAAPTVFGPVEHRYFPVEPGTVWTYEGSRNGAHRRDVVRVLHDTRTVMGVECSALFQEMYLDGVLVERTWEWFAGDQDGNLWKFGEESFDFEDGLVVLTEDSWEAGVGGALPWMVLVADPRPGDVTTNGDEIIQVVSVSAVALVPAGVFRECLEAVENPDDEDDKDVIIYAPGVGLVSETGTDGGLELVSVGNE